MKKNKYLIGYIISLIVSILLYLLIGTLVFLVYIWSGINSLFILLAFLFGPFVLISFGFSIVCIVLEVGYWVSLFLTIFFFKRYKKYKSMGVVDNED